MLFAFVGLLALAAGGVVKGWVQGSRREMAAGRWRSKEGWKEVRRGEKIEEGIESRR